MIYVTVRGRPIPSSSSPALEQRNGRLFIRTCSLITTCCCRHGQVEERLVQRTHGLVAGQEFFHGSGTGSSQGTVQIPGDIGLKNVG